MKNSIYFVLFGSVNFVQMSSDLASVMTQKTWVCPDSPQSTLTGIGSWSVRIAVSSNGSPNSPPQVSSPPTTPFPAPIEPWDLIYEVAGQLASLKTNGKGPPNAKGLFGDPRALIPTTGFLLESLSLQISQRPVMVTYRAFGPNQKEPQGLN
ncbi:uncharacterized protein LOC132279370 [Cornus florida]|uniref:uncharacterized protein LOC132279370 n=1 Tax=Cornus florida TaxID=4283 RepID=UPI00289BE673|nr:uncharacterized protein LOC132279370 [Cornus florida]